jgi:TRAP-type C4-dicarboxylate transport system substrate-binding protein
MKLFISAATACMSLLLGLSGNARADDFTLRIGAGHPTPALVYVIAHDTYFVPEVIRRAKEKGHNVRFIKAWAGTVAKIDAITEAVQNGTLDIGLAAPVFEPTRLGILNFGNLTPFASSDMMLQTKVSMRMVKEIPALKDSLKPFNAELLSMVVGEPYGMTLKEDIGKPEDLKGRKIASGAVNAPWSAAMGAVPVALPVPENYSGMQTGLIDGNMYFVTGMTSFKFYEIAKYFYRTGFGAPPVIATIMNRDTRKKLPKDLLAIIDQVAEETAFKSAEISMQRTREAEAAIQGKVKIIDISEADKRRWATALKDLPGKAAKELDAKGLPGTEVFKAYLRFEAEAGYKFPVNYPM